MKSAILLKISILWLGAVFAAPFSAFGQNQSGLGRFTVNSIVGCAPFQVEIIQEANNLGDVIQYDYNAELPGDNFTNDKSFTYNNPGTYKLVQILQNISPSTDTITITVLPPILPEIEVFTCQNNSISLSVKGDPYEQFFVDLGDGNSLFLNKDQTFLHTYTTQGEFTIQAKGMVLGNADTLNLANISCASSTYTFSTINELNPAIIEEGDILSVDVANGVFEFQAQLTPNVVYFLERIQGDGTGLFERYINQSPIRVENLNTVNQINCFRLVAFDSCNSVRMNSEIICTFTQQVQAFNNQNTVSWSLPGLVASSLDIFKNDTLWQENIIFPNGTRQDNDILCGIEYCYTYQLSLPGNIIVRHPGTCVTGIQTQALAPIRDMGVSVVNESIEVFWEPPSGQLLVYSLYRRQNNQWSLVYEGENATFTDTGANGNTAQVCYRLDYRDNCGNIALGSKEACSIFLQESEAINETLRWNPFSGWQNGMLDYIVETFDASRFKIDESSTAGNVFYLEENSESLDRQTYYRVIGVAADDALPPVFSNTLLIEFPPVFEFPTAFSPNQDGINDGFGVFGRYIQQIDLYIFNKWGEMIFYSNRPEDRWDGTYKGDLVPSGAYLYKARIVDTDGKVHQRDGSVLIIR